MARAENLAIMFVDMAGYAARTARQSRDQNKALLRDFNGLLLPLIARFGGRRIKSIGDALLVTFRSPTDAVRCGMAMHDAVQAYNDERPGAEPIQIRVALNVGEVRIEKDDIFGEAVNIAARVEEMTPPGEIYLTGVVYLSMNKAEVPAEHVGEHALKGIPEPTRLFRVPSHRVARLTPAGEALAQAPGELPYGGMHRLPENSDLFLRLSEAIRRAPYVDWGARARAIPPRIVGLAAAGTIAAAAIGGGGYWLVTRPPPAQAAAADVALPPPPTQAGISDEAREALNAAHTAYFEGRRAEAAAAYARVLDMEPRFRHDSGLAANLVGTLGYAGATASAAIRKYPSPELVYELSRRTSMPGRRGAQRAAGLLDELGQGARVDQPGLALTELAEAPTCAERLAAVRRLREMHEVRALPLLRDATHVGLSRLFGKNPNECLRQEAKAAIAELEKTQEATATPPS